MSSKISLFIKTFLKKRFEEKVFTGLPLTIFVIVFLIFSATFIGITNSVVNSPTIINIDNQFTHYLYTVRVPTLAQIFFVITYFADQITVIILVIISIICLYFRKEFAYLYALLVTFIGSEISVFLIKILINRARPGRDLAYYLETSRSFPSGHSTAAMVFFGFAAYYFMHHLAKKKWKTAITIFAGVLIGLIGFSRLYLGVHFLSDVIGGFFLGGLWLVAGITFREQHFYNSSIKKGKDLSK